MDRAGGLLDGEDCPLSLPPRRSGSFEDITSAVPGVRSGGGRVTAGAGDKGGWAKGPVWTSGSAASQMWAFLRAKLNLGRRIGRGPTPSVPRLLSRLRSTNDASTG